MGSRHVLEQMMQALDGELPSEGQVALEEHLLQCADCRQEWERLLALEQLLQAAPMLQPSMGFAGRVLAHVDKRRSRRRSVLGGVALTFGAAAAAFLMLAPLLWSLPSLSGDLSTLLGSAGLLIARLSGFVSTLVNSLWLTAGALVLPAAPLALCGLMVTFAAGLLWLGLVWKMRPAVTTFSRR